MYGISSKSGSNVKYPGSDSPWGIVGSMMKYWRISDFNEALNQGYLNAMMLNACIYDGKEGKTESSGSMSFFDFGKQLAGMN